MATKDVKVGASAAEDHAQESREPELPGGAAPDPEHPEPKRLVQIVSELWHQKPGRRPDKPGATDRALSTKEIVNGLERKELLIGAVLMALDLLITIVVYVLWHRSSQLKFRHYAPDFLVAGLVGVAILGFGAALRRRALLGFASFIVGMELISFGLVYGIFYLFFGGWLIVRVMRQQRQHQALGKYSGTIDTGPKPRAKTSAPTASKRYTPPRRSRTPAKRR